MEKIIFDNKEYRTLLDHLNQLLEEVEDLPYPKVKELIFSILQCFDSIHREPLHRLLAHLDRLNSKVEMDLQGDFTFQTLLDLYDLKEKEEQVAENATQGFVPADQVTFMEPVKQKEWLELGHIKDFEEKKLYPKNFEQVNFLVSKVDRSIYAIRNQCVDSILPIDQGRIEDHFLICPWHGCRYDLKTGREVNSIDKQLEVFPTQVEEDGLLKVEIAY